MLTVYRRVLHMYPSSFRARFGEEMLLFIRDEAAHGRRVPWLRMFVDLFGSAVVQRWEEGTMRPKIGIALVVTVLAAALTMLFTGSTISGPGILLFITILGAFTAIVVAGALLGRRGAEHAYASRGARWWWVPAAILGAGQIGLGIAQLVSDPKTENVAALFFFSAFSALVFGGMAIRNRTVGNYLIAIGVLPLGSVVWWVFPPVLALIVIVSAIADNVRASRVHAAVQT